ncbi:unnamed protein product [Symbiodinium sp. CCMP2592]|nr:unnamed protein product [Symbiodinium sp. CCMP2592]
MHFVAEDGVSSLGLAFSDMPPSPVIISKVLEGSWGHSAAVPVNAEIRFINAISVSSMDSQNFKAQLQLRPMKLSVRVSEGALQGKVPREDRLDNPGNQPTVSSTTPASEHELQAHDDANLRSELRAKEEELTNLKNHLEQSHRDLREKCQELEASAEAASEAKLKLVAELAERDRELADAKLAKTPLEDTQAKEAEANLQGISGESDDGKQVRQLQEQLSRQESELQRLMADLEDANISLAAKDEKLDSPSSRASFQISPSYWETVELQALKEELQQRDAEVQRLRTSLADAETKIPKLKEGEEEKLKATVPKSVDHWGFRLQRGLVYEVKKGGWAEAVSLRLGDRLLTMQGRAAADYSRGEFDRVKSERPLQLKFQRGGRRQAEEVASTKIQANWKGKKARKLPQIEARLRVGDGEIMTATAEAEAEGRVELGFKLERWPPAPRVLVRSVRRGGWAGGVGMKPGDELLTVQGHSLQDLDRGKFQKLVDKERPLEITFCRGTKEDVQRIASSKIQAGWRQRRVEEGSAPAANAAGHTPAAPAQERVFAMISESTEGATASELKRQLAERERELKILRQEFSKAETMFQTSLRDISTDSSNSAVELASLKAQLVVEQSKAAKCQSDTAAKTTNLSAKLQVEQRKSEALETRLVQAEVIHQEQMSEITDFLTEKQQELRLSDSDLREMSAGRLASGSAGPSEMKELKERLAEEQAKVSQAERKLVKSWSDQRAIDLQWQAEVAARDERLKELRKDLAKAEWWASLSKRSPQHKEILDIKEELSMEQSRAARAERRLAEAQDAARLLEEMEALQDALNHEEACVLQMKTALIHAQAQRKLTAEVATQIQAAADATAKANLEQLSWEFGRQQRELQKVMSEEAAAVKMQARTRGNQARKQVATMKASRKAEIQSTESAEDTKPGATTGPLSSTPQEGKKQEKDQKALDSATLELRTKLTTALTESAQNGALAEGLEKVYGQPSRAVQTLRKEVAALRNKLSLSEASRAVTPPSTPISRRTPAKKKLQQSPSSVRFAMDDEGTSPQGALPPASASGVQQEDAKVKQSEDRAQIFQEEAANFAKQMEQMRKEQVKMKQELDESKAQVLAQETLRRRDSNRKRDSSVRTEREKTDKAIYLSEISAKESMLEKAQEEIRALQDEKADAEKERQREMIPEINETSYSSPELQEQAAENRQLQCSLNMQEELSTELRRRLWEARDELTAAKSMGWQPEVPVPPKAAETQASPKPSETQALPSVQADLDPAPTVEVIQNEDSAVRQAFRHEQEVAQNLRLELREVETAAVATAEAAEARILQIEAMDRRGRVSLHMAETAAEKEVVLKHDAIKAACEAEAMLDQARGTEQRLRHEIYEQSQAAFRESAVCDGLRRALMNSVEQEMAQEALHAAARSQPAHPIPERASEPAGSKPVAQRPGEAPGTSPGGRGAQPSAPRASQLFATKLSNREDLKHDLMSPGDVKSWMEPSMISQPSLLSAAASEAASLRKEAEQLRKEVKHWRASRPARAEPTAPSEAWPASPEGGPAAASPRAARSAMRPDSEQGLNREDSWRRSPEASPAQTQVPVSQVPSPRSQQLPMLHEQPPPRPPPGRT